MRRSRLSQGYDCSGRTFCCCVRNWHRPICPPPIMAASSILYACPDSYFNLSEVTTNPAHKGLAGIGECDLRRAALIDSQVQVPTGRRSSAVRVSGGNAAEVPLAATVAATPQRVDVTGAAHVSTVDIDSATVGASGVDALDAPVLSSQAPGTQRTGISSSASKLAFAGAAAIALIAAFGAFESGLFGAATESVRPGHNLGDSSSPAGAELRAAASSDRTFDRARKSAKPVANTHAENTHAADTHAADTHAADNDAGTEQVDSNNSVSKDGVSDDAGEASSPKPTHEGSVGRAPGPGSEATKPATERKRAARTAKPQSRKKRRKSAQTGQRRGASAAPPQVKPAKKTPRVIDDALDIEVE